MNTIQEKLQEISQSINFNAEEHVYTSTINDKTFTSVSEIIAQYSRPFDKVSTAKHIAGRDGTFYEDVLESWRVKRDYAAVRGTEFHLLVKCFLNSNNGNGILEKPITPIANQIKAFNLFWQRNAMHYEVVGVECIVTDTLSMTAGTVDLLAMHKRTGKYYLFDWKTSEQIRLKNNFHETLLAPLANVENCELNRYSLQLSIYKALLQKALHIKIEKCYFVQFKSNATYEVFEGVNFYKESTEILWKE